ncbi:hypothetical protein RHMOL_Rhmol07G0005400 [Rhododendron molle]|uniref:Uncharacterized protein n=2 Tax=Rhododendron molle TaxID=49168 RepID=A0ACC0MW20_RHOML|nr:hypothetical protein RHMOL_Rhmol09G0127400 [Rhododendron molle]KAI8544951.1 hypothetical protein RHMOL_Rhmol07G0005400 [Rhododendron molle]
MVRKEKEGKTNPPVWITEVAGLQWSSLKQRKMMIGSRPPGCVNKCMSCRPCVATLVVIHPHDNNKKGEFAEISDSVSRREDDPYYLLSWKCKCGDKLYQP